MDSQVPSFMSAELTSFIGRRHEMSLVRGLLSERRLVTLTGAGGIGKTRLALRVATAVRRAFPGGVWPVELAPVAEASLVVQTVADAIGLSGRTSRPPLETLQEFLAKRDVLLVLDNCEHLTEACGALVTALLRTAPGLKVLATSRQTLGVPGEAVLPVPPLSLPDTCGDSRALTQSEAVSLFLDRASLVRPGFEAGMDRAAVIAEICRQLDGMPLAIELAAARVRVLSVEEILLRLEDRLGLLTQGPRLPSRHRTLRAAINWSYDMCSAREQLLWSRLSVFHGGFDLDAAEEICSGPGIEPVAILDLISDLVDKSVLSCDESGPRVRYQVLETLRLYGEERLTACGQQEVFQHRHLVWYRSLAEAGQWDWRDSHHVSWLARMGMELANIRTALAYGLKTPGQTRSAMALASALVTFWLISGSFTEARMWLSRALAADSNDSAERAEALWVIGLFAAEQGDPSDSSRQLAEAKEVAARVGAESAEAWTLLLTGQTKWMGEGDLASGAALLKQALAQQRRLGDPNGTILALALLGMAQSHLGDPSSAESVSEALDLCEKGRNSFAKAEVLSGLGTDLLRRGHIRQATPALQESLRLQRSLGDRLGCAVNIEVLAWVAGSEGRHERAARLLGAAHFLFETMGVSMVVLPTDVAQHEHCRTQASQALGAAFEEAFAAGHAMPLEEASAYALGQKMQASAVTAHRIPRESSTPTPREREVAALIAQGLSNKEIAARLVISLRTAEGHVEHLLTKLGFTSRAQIAAWFTRQRAGA